MLKKSEARKEILLVDDDPNYSEIMRIRLEADGYQVSCASNGREALELLDREPAPGLIIMDMDMPDKNGLTTLIHLGIRGRKKEHPERRDIPVIVATGLQSDQVRDIVMEQEVSGYLRKPYDYNELRQTVQRLIG